MNLAVSFLSLLSPLVSSLRNSSQVVAPQNSSTPKIANAATTQSTLKTDNSADLAALDDAMAKLPEAPKKAEQAKAPPKPASRKVLPKVSKPAANRNVSKSMAKKAAQALNVPSKEDVKLSDLAKKNKDFAVKDDADAVLEAGDALAKKAIEKKHHEKLEKVAPAKVVHVDGSAAKPDASEGEGLDSAKTLASDLEGLKERVAEQKAEKSEDQKRHERHKLKVQATKDARAKRNQQFLPSDKKKQRAMNLNRLVKLTNEIKNQASFLQKQVPVETHSTLEAHAGKLQEAQQEVDNMKAQAKHGSAMHSAPVVEEKERKFPEPSKEAAAPSQSARKVTTASHHPENTEHLKNINEAVGHLNEEETPANVKEVQEVLKKAEAMTGAAKEAPVAQFTADPHKAHMRAKKFKNKMEDHVSEMHEALHEHQKAVDTKNHLEKIRKQREAEAVEREQWEAEQKRLEQLKLAAEKMQREKKEKERNEAIENRTATEAAHKVFDPQAEYVARKMRKPETSQPKSSADTIGRCSLVLIAVVAFFA